MRLTFDAADNCPDNADALRFLIDAEAIARVAFLQHAQATEGNRLLWRFADALRDEAAAMAKRIESIPLANRMNESKR